MKARISYVSGYGWHIGRLLWWPTLLVAGLCGGFAATAAEVVLRALTSLQAPYALFLPVTILYVAVRRLRARWRGDAPFVYDPYFDDAYELSLIWRAAEPTRFRRVLYLESLMWASIVSAAAYMPATFWWRGL